MNPDLLEHIKEAIDLVRYENQCRETALVKTKLEEALMWLEAARKATLDTSSTKGTQS